MEVRIVIPLCDAEWERLAAGHPDYNFFHSAAWARVLSRTYGHEPVYLHCSEGGELVALIPMMEVCSPLTGRRGVCLPFTDFCDPLVFGESGTAISINKLNEVARERKWKYFEIRGGRRLEAAAGPALRFYGHTLDLRRGVEDLRGGLKSSVRRALRKAERSGLNVEISWTRKAVLQFYRLHTRTRKRHGLPPQPVSFFLNIYDEIIRQGLGFIAIASLGSRPVAAAVFFHFGNKAIYKFSASDERLWEFRGNDLIVWEGIRFLSLKGAATLHFGRTSVENDGLRRFKLGWGTDEERIEYLRFDSVAEAWVTRRDAANRFHELVFARLPFALNRLAGSIIYPHLD